MSPSPSTPPINRPLSAPDSNQTITLPASATLNGTATDDGLPAGSTLTRTWSKASGPGTVTFGNVNAQSTTANFSAAGTYVLRLTAFDSALSASADVAVSVNAANQAPVVSAGSNQTIALPAPATLNGAATDDGLPAGSTLTRTWSKVSGPGTVTFGNVNAQSTTANFSAAGTYVLRLTAFDSALSASADVAVSVNAANQTPVVSAGSNQTIVLPAPVTLNGTATDDGLPAGSTLIRTWSKVSGPGTVAFGNVNAQSTTANFSAAGTYVLRLTAFDSALSVSADVTIVVNASNCSGVTVPSTTTDLQAVVSAYPEGTTFCFQAGTYRLDGPVIAKSRDRFIGQPGTILDGQGTVARGIWGYGGPTGQRDVVVQGLTFANFTGTAISMGWYWTVSQNDMHHNQIAVEVNSYSTLDRNYIHDNRQYGLTGGPGADMLIVNNEVARNNTGNDCGGGCGGNAGGSKIIGSAAGTTGLVWRNNNVHDNTGHGIWSDGNVRGALYEGNIVSNNSGSGIFHEISWDAIIRNNTLTNNDSEAIGKSCWWGANILINTSSNVEVYGNTITASNGSNGICAVSSDRPDATAPYPTVVANFYAHDNVVSMTGSATSGLVGYAGTQQSIRPQHVFGNRYESCMVDMAHGGPGNMGHMARERRSRHGRHTR